MSKITESEIELYSLEELEKSGFHYLSGPEIAPDGITPERQDYSTILLIDRLKTAIQKLNPVIPADVLNLAISQLQRIHSPELITNNELFHRYLTDGIPVTWHEKGVEKNDYVWLIDFKSPANNEFLAINQYTIIENNQNKDRKSVV